MIITITSGALAYGAYTVCKEVGKMYDEYKRNKKDKKK